MSARQQIDPTASHARAVTAGAVDADARRIRQAIARDQLRTCHPFNTRRRVLDSIARRFWNLAEWMGREDTTNRRAAARGLRAVQRVRF